MANPVGISFFEHVRSLTSNREHNIANLPSAYYISKEETNLAAEIKLRLLDDRVA